MDQFESQRGQSLIEVLIGVGLGALFVIGAAAIIAPSLQTNTDVTQIQIKSQLASELLDNVRSWTDGNWDNMLALATGSGNPYYLITSSSPFTVPANNATGTETITIRGQVFVRYFYLSDVYRDGNGNVTTTTSGNFYDPSTKLVTVIVAASGTSPMGTTSENLYVTRNANDVLNQTSWSGGSGYNNSVSVIGSFYASSTDIAITASGSIQLAGPPGGTCVL